MAWAARSGLVFSLPTSAHRTIRSMSNRRPSSTPPGTSDNDGAYAMR